jgi:hypothetical protein
MAAEATKEENSDSFIQEIKKDYAELLENNKAIKQSYFMLAGYCNVTEAELRAKFNEDRKILIQYLPFYATGQQKRLHGKKLTSDELIEKGTTATEAAASSTAQGSAAASAASAASAAEVEVPALPKRQGSAAAASAAEVEVPALPKRQGSAEEDEQTDDESQIENPALRSRTNSEVDNTLGDAINETDEKKSEKKTLTEGEKMALAIELKRIYREYIQREDQSKFFNAAISTIVKDTAKRKFVVDMYEDELRKKKEKKDWNEKLIESLKKKKENAPDDEKLKIGKLLDKKLVQQSEAEKLLQLAKNKVSTWSESGKAAIQNWLGRGGKKTYRKKRKGKKTRRR